MEQPKEEIASNKIHPLGEVISFNIGAGSTTIEYCATKAIIFSSLSSKTYRSFFYTHQIAFINHLPLCSIL
jgi:hypothetical protein